MMRIPMRMRTAMPPITAPTIRPVDGPELFDDDAADEEVDCAEACEAFDFIGLALEASVVGTEVCALFLALDAAVVACVVVRAVVAMPGKLGIAVGIASVTLCSDRKEAAMPPTLFKMLPICLRSLRWMSIVAILPAARQLSRIDASALARLEGSEAWLS
jgi:hypothetical protein